jgi:hypothetical protein
MEISGKVDTVYITDNVSLDYADFSLSLLHERRTNSTTPHLFRWYIYLSPFLRPQNTAHDYGLISTVFSRIGNISLVRDVDMAPSHQYLDIIVKDDMKYDIRIENAQMERYLLHSLLWVISMCNFWHWLSGEFYRLGNPNDVLTTDDINDMSIRHNGGSREICSISEPGSMLGPSGAVDLVDDVRDTRICTLTWRATMKPGEHNSFLIRNHNPNYRVDIGKWNESGTIGEVPVSIGEK